MEIILKANVPRKLAVRATKEAKLQIETNRAALEAQFQKELAAAGDVAAKLSQISVNLERRVVEGDRLYGSVTAGDIADAITKAGVKVTRAQVELAEPIKQVGVFTVTIKVFGDVEAQVKVWVVAAK